MAAAAGVAVAQRGAAPVTLPGAHGRRRDAPAQRLAHRAGRTPHRDRRPAARDGPLARRPLAHRHQQRLPEADAARRRSRARRRHATVALDDAWLGLAWHPDGKRLYSSGAASNSVQRAGVGERAADAPGTKTRRRRATTPLGAGRRDRPSAHADVRRRHRGQPGRHAARTPCTCFGKCVSARRSRRRARSRADRGLPAEPYTCLLSPDGTTLFVSLWGGARVLLFDAKTLAPTGEIVVGEHPNAMVLSARRHAAVRRVREHERGVGRSISRRRRPTEQISIALFPERAAGLDAERARALARRPAAARRQRRQQHGRDGGRLDSPAQSRVLGLHPDRLVSDGRRCSAATASQLFVLSGKGLTSMPNPRGAAGRRAAAARASTRDRCSRARCRSCPTPDDDGARGATRRRSTTLTPYTRRRRGWRRPRRPAASPIPRRVGDPSPIKHVFYVIRENRTYDQILGDLDRGNGDPTLALFGEDVTPNAHALAREFVTLDNFYVNAEVSYDGHAFSTGAYATDFVEKIWPTNYGGRGGPYLSEGGGEMRNAVRQHRGAAERLHLGRASCAPARPCAATASSRATTRRRQRPGKVGAGHRARARGPRASDVPAVRPEDSRQHAHRRLARGVQAVRGERPAAGARRSSACGNDHTNGTRAGFADAARDDRGERPRARPPRRRDQPQRLLEGLGDLRARRRRAERAGPRGRAPVAGVRRQPVRRAAASSTARSTRRRACCARWS